MFYYPNMLRQHDANAPLALVWVNIEEIKRFGLALYKVCQLATCSNLNGESVNSGRNDLLTLSDLSFCIPDSDELWNVPPGTESEKWRAVASSAVERDNGDPKNWISQASTLLHDAQVSFDWI
jgi:hypothetical protein